MSSSVSPDLTFIGNLDHSHSPEQWFPAAAWVNYGKKIRDGTFSGKTGFKLDGGMKDAAFIRRLGAESSTPTPIIDQAWSHLTTAKALGGPDMDWSSCSAGMRVTAGLPPFKGEDFSLRREPQTNTAPAVKKSCVHPEPVIENHSAMNLSEPNGTAHTDTNGTGTDAATNGNGMDTVMNGNGTEASSQPPSRVV